MKAPGSAPLDLGPLRAGGLAGAAVVGLIAAVALGVTGLTTGARPPGQEPGHVRSEAIATTAPPWQPGDVLRIMPLGDSITVGIGSRDGDAYRARLFHELRDAGLTVDFVGSQRSGAGADPDHEGHGGWTIERLATHVNRWLAAYRPDAVLLHIGTNDVSRGEPAARIAGKLSALLDRIRAACPATHIFVSQIVRSRVPAELAVDERYNALLRRVVARKGPFVMSVSQSTVTNADLHDVRHPNDCGYRKMADNFLPALLRVYGAHLRPRRIPVDPVARR